MNTAESDDKNTGIFRNRMNILPTRYAGDKIDKRVILSAICLVGVVFVTLGLFFTSHSPENRTMAAVQASQKPTTPAITVPNNGSDNAELPALNGENAIRHLKNNGMYSSLGEAVTAARYKPEKIDKNFVASNHANGIKAEFDETGVTLSSTNESAKWESTWRLQSVGYENEQTAIKSGELSSKGRRVEIKRDEASLVEWFENRPQGLEHGFTLSKRPRTKQNPTGSLRLMMDISGDLKAEADNNGQGLTLTDRKGKEVIRYKKLKVWDADKTEQKARMQVSDDNVILDVEEANAKYPLTIDPTFGSTKLLASDGAGHDWFGGSVSISGDKVIVGAYLDDDNGDASGSAYIFVRNADGWNQQAKLTPSDGVEHGLFGESVSISGDTAIVGVTHNSGAYIFERNSGGTNNWGEVIKLTPSDGQVDDDFGFSVSISGDTAIVGSVHDDDNGSDSGSAYVFVRDGGGGWNEQAKLLASVGSPIALFGFSVSIFGDTVIVGASNDDSINGFGSGSAYVFVRDGGGGWIQQAKLTSFDIANGDNFGASVSIFEDTLLVGAFGDGPETGSAYIFVRNGAIWNEQAKLTASDNHAFDWFGREVSIFGDTAIVGAVHDDNETGSAYLFEKNAGGANNWGEVTKLTASDTTVNDQFGSAVAISGDMAIVGAQFDDNRRGSVHVFNLPFSFLIADIEDLVEQGALSLSHGRALINKLNLAIRQLAKGNTNAALNKLADIIVQTQDFIANGHLSPENGQSIIDSVQAIIDSIDDGNP